MQVVMYHYVGFPDTAMPYARFLHAADFEKQLQYFAREYGIANPESVCNPPEAGFPQGQVLLTFDDGLRCHYEVVLPILQKLGYRAIFFINTIGYSQRRLAGVHAVHWLLARYPAAEVWQWLQQMLSGISLSQKQMQLYRSGASPYQHNDSAERKVKELLNYFLSPAQKQQVVQQLMQRCGTNMQQLADDYYMTVPQLQAMQQAGMLLGGHTVSHPVLSHLPPQQQHAEIVASQQWINNTIGLQPIQAFCYPFGYPHTINQATLDVMSSEGFDFGFVVEPRHVQPGDLVNNRYRLPRYDCNAFPFGKIYNSATL